MTLTVGEYVQAIFDGEWYPATIEAVEQRGVYTVKWNTPCPMISKGYLECELVSTNWQRQIACKQTENELQDKLSAFFERMENASDNESSGLESLDDEEWSADEGVKVAQDLLQRYNSYEEYDKRIQGIGSSSVELELPHYLWVTASQDGAPRYKFPDLNNALDGRVCATEIVVALRLVEQHGKQWIILDEDIWVPREALEQFEGAEPQPEDQAGWLFDGCDTVELLRRRATDRLIDNSLREGKPLQISSSPALRVVALFFPRLSITQDFRSIQEVCGLVNYRWDDESLAKEVLGFCLLSLWRDVRSAAGINSTANSRDWLAQMEESNMDMRLLRFLSRHRFDCRTPEFLKFVLQTGKIRVSKYLYAVGPLISTEWTAELANGIAMPLKNARSDVLYANIQAMMKYGYRLPLEKIIRKWKRVDYIDFKWKHDRALRTFKSSARVNRYGATTMNKVGIVKDCCRQRGLSKRPEKLIVEFVNAFRHYNVAPDAHLQDATSEESAAHQWQTSGF